MIIEHRGKKPKVHPSAYVAPNAVVSGDVTIGANTCILYGATLSSEGGPLVVGDHCIVMENAVLRASEKYPLSVSDHVLVGPLSYLTGCCVDSHVFLAAGCRVYYGAHIKSGAEVRVNAVIHLKTVLEQDAVVPIGWVAVGNPAKILPPHEHDKIWAIQRPLDFPMAVCGLERKPPKELMEEMSHAYATLFGTHDTEKIVSQ